MIIVTTNEIPGYRIEAVLGEVMGMTVRSANFGANITASFRSIGGGEVTEYTKIVYESRNEVMNRMWQQAMERGANAIIGMRFDTGDMGQAFTEVCAYGTAVVAVPLGEDEPGATPQSIAISRQRAAAPPAGAPQPGPGQPGGPGAGPQGPGGHQAPPQPVMP
ncbi:MAG: YbjQ family protein [Propionibacterium sp.]|nr:YbjQ family protein [Propionibacterium sp.]